MEHTAVLKRRKKLACPTCNTSVHFQAERNNFSSCPRCGEWLIETGRWNRKLERLDYEPSRDFDESGDWEQSLMDKIK